jgi:hypothetical protein
MVDHGAPRKYAPLAAYLDAQRADCVTLTLPEIEQVIGATLPRGAWMRGWWQVRQDQGRLRPWLAAGWRVAGVAMRQVPPTITFTRVADSTMEPRAAAGLLVTDRARQRSRRDPRLGDESL